MLISVRLCSKKENGSSERKFVKIFHPDPLKKMRGQMWAGNLHCEWLEEPKYVVGLVWFGDEDGHPIVHVGGGEVHHYLPLIVPDHPSHRHVRLLLQNVS